MSHRSTNVLYVVVIIASAALAFAVYSRSTRAPTTRVELAGDDPLWYREGSLELRLAATRKRLDLMTSTAIPATQAGPLKDEIALLCRDPRIVDVIVKSYRERRDIGAAQISAYMEIFGRVKNDAFASLVVDGVSHEDFEPRLNAIEAAIVQRDPRTVPFLAAALERLEGHQAGKVIAALALIGTGEALDAVVAGVGSPDHDKAIHCIRVVAANGLVESLPALEDQLAAADPEVRLVAAWGLAVLGRTRGLDLLVRTARDTAASESLRAQAVQFVANLSATRNGDALVALAVDASSLVRTEARIGLARRREAATLAALEKELGSDDPAARREAIGVLGRTGSDEDLARLRARVADLSGFEVEVLLRSLAVGRPPGAVAFLAELGRREDVIGLAAAKGLGVYGEQAVPQLAALIESADDVARKGELLATVAGIISPSALAVLERFDPEGDRRLWLLVRTGIRHLELELMKGDQRL